MNRKKKKPDGVIDSHTEPWHCRVLYEDYSKSVSGDRHWSKIQNTQKKESVVIHHEKVFMPFLKPANSKKLRSNQNNFWNINNSPHGISAKDRWIARTTVREH